MTSSVTHFEIYGENPARLADFYRNVFGWEVEQMPGINYWRIQTRSAETKPLHGGVTYRAISDLNGWMVGRAVLCPPRGIHMISAHGVTRPTLDGPPAFAEATACRARPWLRRLHRQNASTQRGGYNNL